MRFSTPAWKTRKVFNDGFVNNPHPEFGCGPFKLADKGWNSTENTFTMVPNEKWWGEKPMLTGDFSGAWRKARRLLPLRTER